MNLSFTPAQEIQTEQGRRWVQKAYPTSEFWKQWRFNKAAVSRAGLSVGKPNGEYMVFRILDFNPDKNRPHPVVSPFTLTRTRGKLMDFQPPLVAHLAACLLTHGIAIDKSDAGVGKTYHSLAVCAELGLRPGIVCTLSGMLAWKKCCAYFNLNPFFIINWEGIIARQFKTGEVKCSFPYIHVKRGYTGKLSYQWILPKNNVCLIFDESHKGNGWTTSQGKIFMAAKGFKTICLSATLAERPEQIRNLGVLCGIFEYSNFNDWLRRIGCYESQWGGKWHSPCAAQDMSRVSGMLFPRFGGGLKKADIAGFPDIQNIAQAYPIKDVKAHNKAYQSFLQELTKLEQARLQIKRQRDQETDKARLADLLEKMNSAQANKMVLNLRYRQFVEYLKVSLFVQLANEYIEAGHSVAVFVNFTATLKAIAKKLHTSCVVHGGQSGSVKGARERNNCIDDFQADKSRVIVCNIAAGGISISLHDTLGLHSRVALISPTYHAKQLVQVLGRIHRSGAKSKAINRLIYAAGTVEDAVCRAVSGKVDAINALNDADLAEHDIFNLMKG